MTALMAVVMHDADDHENAGPVPCLRFVVNDGSRHGCLTFSGKRLLKEWLTQRRKAAKEEVFTKDSPRLCAFA